MKLGALLSGGGREPPLSLPAARGSTLFPVPPKREHAFHWVLSSSHDSPAADAPLFGETVGTSFFRHRVDAAADATTAKVLRGGLRAARRLATLCLTGKRRLPVRRAPSKLCATLARSRRLRMDGTRSSISPRDLYDRLGTAQAPILIDVRKAADFAASDRCIVAAFHRAPDDIARWSKELPAGRPVVVHCVRGGQTSQTAAAALAAAGHDAAYLEGGITAWSEAGLPTRRKLAVATGKWVTRERPKIDRIACPWLIIRFIDPNAQFIYVPDERVLAVAKETGAIPYDVKGVEYTHEGERCSFDTIVRIHDIHDPALDRLATIVRGADTSRHDLAE